MSVSLKKETFEPLLNKKFTITFDEQNSYEVELIDIKTGNEIKALNIEPFSLMFRGPIDSPIFTQRIYKLHSEDIGDLELFFDSSTTG